MKLSFSLSSKPSSKPNPKNPSQEETNKDDFDSNHEFVTEFDSSKTLTFNKPKHIIPRLENTWKPKKKMKNLDLPIRSASDDPDLRFEVEAPSTADTNDSSMSYGLNLRSKDDNDGSEPPSTSTENVLLQKFKEDMKNLPEDRGLDEFIDVPVEGFGAALLTSYGWSEGKGIGKNVKEDVTVVQYVRRAGREGLGFEPEVRETEQRGVVVVASKGSNGKNRHVVGVDEKLVPRELKGIHVGKIVRVVDGRHEGLKGKVLKKLVSGSESSTSVILKLTRSDEEVTVGIDKVAELGSVEEERCLRKLQELKIGESNDDRRQRRDSSSYGEVEKRDRGRDDKKKDKRRNREEGGSGKEGKHDKGAAYRSSGRDYGSRKEGLKISWLTSHIRVRIISKDFKGGKLYLKKGEVVDVVGPNICDISMDGSKELIQGVDQDILETALPRSGGPVLILYGKHKGVFGHLVERNMEKETGVVQDADSQEMLNVPLEQVAEYIGDPSCIGY